MQNKKEEYTLKQETRAENRNEMYADEKNFEVITQCPDCGCDITMLNNGGNGFCSDCVADH